MSSNGPNLNMLGKREPEIYGSLTLPEIESFLSSNTDSVGGDVGLSFFQSNSEGEIVTAIQDAYGKFDGIIIKPRCLYPYKRSHKGCHTLNRNACCGSSYFQHIQKGGLQAEIVYLGRYRSAWCRASVPAVIT